MVKGLSLLKRVVMVKRVGLLIKSQQQ